MKNPFADISRFRSQFSSRRMTLLWYRSYRRVFVVFFIVLLMVGAWYWYYNLYRYSWDEGAKKVFLDSYVQEKYFKEIGFRKAVSVSQEKRKRYEAGVSLKHDLFRLDVLPESKK